MEDPRILERLRRFQPEGQRIITIKSRREKLGAVFGDIITELEALHMALRGHNDDLEQLRNQSNNQRTSRNTQSPLPLGVPLTPVPGSLVSKAAEALKLHLMQTASKELHGLVLGRLEVPCQCHKLHLCLGDLAAPTDDDVLEDSNADPGRKNAQFYFWLPGSATNGGSKSINTQSSCEIAGPWDADPAVPSLIFSGRLIKPEEQLLVDDLIPPVDLYQKLRNDQFEFRSYASDHSRVEFHLRRTSSVQPFSSIQASHLEPPSDYSIDKLISLDRQMLSNIDIAEISANLAKSVLFFYNSPWIRNWSMDTIRFYGHTSDSTCPRWVPHILVTFSNGDSNQDHFGATSRAIRQLGHILLQIGRKERLDRRHGETDAALLKRALVDLRTTMGTDYKKAVRNFICQWGSEGLDIMEDCHLAGFLSDLGTFERYYKPVSCIGCSRISQADTNLGMSRTSTCYPTRPWRYLDWRTGVSMCFGRLKPVMWKSLSYFFFCLIASDMPHAGLSACCNAHTLRRC
jgi:hypothetical protein